MQLYVLPCWLIQKYIAALFYLVDSYIYNDVKTREMYIKNRKSIAISEASAKSDENWVWSTNSAARLDPSKWESRRKNWQREQRRDNQKNLLADDDRQKYHSEKLG